MTDESVVLLTSDELRQLLHDTKVAKREFLYARQKWEKLNQKLQAARVIVPEVVMQMELEMVEDDP